MENDIKFDIKYDYLTALVFGDNTETLIGGSEKILKKALKNSKNPNLDVKGLDVYYRGKPIGTLAVDINSSSDEVEKVLGLADKLYANLLNSRTNSSKIADTKISLEAIFRTDKSATIRVLARTVSDWYDAVTDLYMNGKFGFALKAKDRAALGEQFRNDVNALTETLFTRLKKKKSPQNDAEISDVIRFNCVDIGEFLDEYTHYLSVKKVYCIHCGLCGEYFIASAKNTRFCTDCKLLRKQNSKKIYANKCAEGVHKERQIQKFCFENYVHKNKLWRELSEDEKARYIALRKEFVETSAKLLREYEQDNSAEREEEIKRYLDVAKSKRTALECEFEKTHRKVI